MPPTRILLTALVFAALAGSVSAQCVGTDPDDPDLDGLTNAEEIALGTDCNNPDTDGDTFLDGSDNCPLVGNLTQVDADGDGFGAACDCDDGSPATNPGAAETCTNGLDDDCDGDTDAADVDCQSDRDGDGVLDFQDNCPDARNSNQRNRDGDSFGDACDNCANATNEDQADQDGDQIGDVCDACPTDPLNDGDADGLCADADNCPLVANPLQEDRDNDNHGDVCDNCPDIRNGNQRDRDTDGAGEACDCDDQDPSRSPLEPEDCGNGVDDDCDLATDGADADCAAVDLLRNGILGVVDLTTFAAMQSVLPLDPVADLFRAGVALPVTLLDDVPLPLIAQPHPDALVFYQLSRDAGLVVFIERVDADSDGLADDIVVRR